MGLGDLDIGDAFWQVLGTAGFMETIFELVYVSSQGSDFMKFERFFFVYTASWELLGELVALYMLREMFFSSSDDAGDESKAEEGGVANGEGEGKERFRRWDIAKVILRDPIYNLAHPVDLTRGDDEESRSPGTLSRLYNEHPTLEVYVFFSLIGVVLPACSTIIWAVFLPMWGMFDGEDYDLRLWICISFWIWVTVVSVVVKKVKGVKAGLLVFFVTAYCLNKAVEVFLLFSREDRLAQGFVGQGLRSLQVTELGSVAIIVYRAIFTDAYEED